MRATEQPHASIPLDLLSNDIVERSKMAPLPANLVFLSCDPYSMLPLVSELTPEQALYFYYTAYSYVNTGNKQQPASTIYENPRSLFHPCLGRGNLIYPPKVYGDLFYERVKEAKPKIWLVNTGWHGGNPGLGKKISLEQSRGLIDLIIAGKLDECRLESVEKLAVRVPVGWTLPGTSAQALEALLNPQKAWKDAA